MKSTELRIGNWFKTFEIDQPRGEEYYQIESFSQNKEKALGVEFRNGSCWSIVDLIEPIPLTEEWLVKFGFDIRFCSQTQIERAVIGYLNEENFYQYDLNLQYHPSHGWFFNDINHIVGYVHQLQNIYFCLTGEELTIKG